MVNVNPSRPWWRPLGRQDRWALLICFAVPALLFGLPTLFGHPPLAGDNLIQNYPLRVLTGQIIRDGHLPLMNRLANSGTPLLGGMNAGSFFPLTLIFVFLPGLFAWWINLVAVYCAAAAGVFWIVRTYGASTWPALLAGLVYAWSGMMLGQMVHLGVVQGQAVLPWIAVMVLSLATRVRHAHEGSYVRRVLHLAPPILGLAIMWALIGLTGEPRAIADAELFSLALVVALLVLPQQWRPRSWRERLEFLGALLVATAWGAMTAAAQLLPGLKFIGVSQRSGISYAFFGSGSLPPRWTSYLFIQDLAGGNGLLHVPSYFNTYNLPEVTIYCTLVGLVALFGLAIRCTRRGWKGSDRNWSIWIVIAMVGALAAWGSYIKTGPLFHLLPLLKSTRLQSRSFVLFDLAAAVTVGYFLEQIKDGKRREAGVAGLRRWFTSIPLALTFVLSSIGFVWPRQLENFVGVPAQALGQGSLLRPTFAIAMILAVLVGVSLVLPNISPKRRITMLYGLVVADLLATVVFSTTGLSSGHVNPQPSRANAQSVLTDIGRYALVDTSGANRDAFDNLGSPNLNVFTGMWSIQGYGSLIAQHYGDVTASHPMFGLDPCKLAAGVFSQLRLATLVIGSQELLGSAAGGPDSSCSPAKSQNVTHRYFGRVLKVQSITINGPARLTVGSGQAVAELLNPQGHVSARQTISLTSHQVVVHWGGLPAAGVLFAAPHGMRPVDVNVKSGQGSYSLNSSYQSAVDSINWKLRTTTNAFAVFQTSQVRPMVWIPSHQGAAKVIHTHTASWGDTWTTIEAQKSTIVERSFSAIPGWRVTALNVSTGKEIQLSVHRRGLIQAVTVPAGTWQIHFHYHAPFIELALTLSAIGSLMFLVSLFAVWRHHRRAR